MISLPSLAVKHLGHNGYLGLLAATLISTPFFGIAADFARLFPGESIIHIFRRVLGKYFGFFFSTLLIILGFGILYVALNQANLMIMTYFFTRTPRSLVVIIFIVFALYISRKGVLPIGRLAGFILIPPLAAIYLMLFLGFANVSLVNIRPVMEGTPSKLILSGLELLNPLFPGTIVFFYLQFLRGPKNILKTSLLAFAVVFPVFFLLILGTLGTFGPEVISKMAWPGIEFFHIIDFPFLLLEQAGLLFVITWYSLQFFATSQAIFALGNIISNVFPKFKPKTAILLVVALILPLVLFPVNITTLTALTTRFQVPAILINLSLYLITWLVARIRNWRADVSGQENPAS